MGLLLTGWFTCKASCTETWAACVAVCRNLNNLLLFYSVVCCLMPHVAVGDEIADDLVSLATDPASLVAACDLPLGAVPLTVAQSGVPWLHYSKPISL